MGSMSEHPILDKAIQRGEIAQCPHCQSYWVASLHRHECIGMIRARLAAEVSANEELNKRLSEVRSSAEAEKEISDLREELSAFQEDADRNAAADSRVIAELTQQVRNLTQVNEKNRQAYHEVVDRAEKADADVRKLLTLLNRACAIIQKIPASGSVRISTPLDNEAHEFLNTVSVNGEIVVTLERGGQLGDASTQNAMQVQMDSDARAIQRAGIAVKCQS